MSELLTHDHFAGCVGETFRVRGAGERSVELELIEADLIGREIPEVTRRQPFSLVFRGPRDVVLQQGNYDFEHPGLGTHRFLIVPIAPDAQGRCYQAIFS